jgi:hypothetical protein
VPDLRARTIAVTLVAGLSLAACGDDSGDPLSKEDFIAQADAICADHGTQLDAIFEEAFAEVDETDLDDPEAAAQQYAGVVADSEPVMRDQVEALRALEPPEADADELQSQLDDLDAAVTEFVDLVEAGAAGDEEALAAIESDVDPFAAVNERAFEYGLQVCGAEG